MKRLFFALYSALLSTCNQSHAQELQIGDTVPHIKFTASHYKRDYIDLSEFKGKTTVLVFWSQVCINCFKSFPKIDSLQKEFGDKVQFILVDRDTPVETEAFFKKRKRILVPDVPMIHDAKVMPELFPYNSVPFHVWIDKAGKVLYKTGGYSTNKENLATVINGGKLKVLEYEPVYFKPSLFDTDYKNKLTYFSYLSRCIGNLHLSSLKGVYTEELYFSCAAVADLYIRAYDEDGKYKLNRPGRVRYLFRDPSRFVVPSDKSIFAEWLASNAYNYHLLVPNELSEKRFQIMREELNRVFPIKAQLVTRKIKCLVLKKTPEIGRLKTKGGEQMNHFNYSGIKTPEEYNEKVLINIPYSEFSYIMIGSLETTYNMPVLDFTGFQENIDIRLSGDAIDVPNLPLLQKELKMYGITLEEKMCPIQILELRDK